MVKPFESRCFKDWFNCPIMQILQLLLDMEARNGEHQISPSNYMREMLLSTEQRYERLIHSVRNITSCVNLKSFKVMPEIVVFQNFVREGIYSVQLNVMNTSDSSKSIRVSMEPSTYFTIKQSGDCAGTKIAPGLKFICEIRFTTKDLQDYRHKITFITSDETFEVPILAIGPRPLLDLPDKIVLPKTAIKVSTERTIVVKNISDVWAMFVLEASNYFEVEPTQQVLKNKECCKITIHFHPDKVGLIEGELKFIYETGEILYVQLEGFVEEADVSLSVEKVNFIDCYLGLSAENVVTLKNDSDYVLDYRWITHECSICQRKIRSAIKERFENLMEYELMRDNTLDYYEIVDSEMNKEIYERILVEQKKECDMSLEPVFSNLNYVIEPTVGKIWPNSKVNFSVIYAPKDVDFHKTLAYLDVSGRSKSYHLDMFGTCEGPKINMNLEELDAQNIYIGSVHRYEVAFQNDGPIPGTVKYLNVDTKFGGVFKCNEDDFTIHPEEIKCVFVEFTSLTRGKFTETIKFEVIESNEILSFLMKGNIVCPLLNFDVTVLDFGNISVGESKICHFQLENNTQVSIEYKIEIVASNQLLGDIDCSELSCSSSSGIAEPYTKIPYYVEVKPNEAIDKLAELSITMWEARQTSRTVYISYKAHVPTIQCLTPNISIKSMFITQTYFRTLVLENKSDFMGRLILNTVSEEGVLQMDLEKTEIFIKAWDSFDIRLAIRTDVIGDMQAKVTGKFFGASSAFTICDIVVLSRGPCIDTDLLNTNIGKVKTLTTIKKEFMLCNDSPISATVYLKINGPYITPAKPAIYLNPEESITSHLIIYGTCAGRFKTSVKMEIEGADSDKVLFTGEFVGSSISTAPVLEPYFDIGAISTFKSFMKEVSFCNEGKVGHIINIKEYDTTVVHLVNPPIENNRAYFGLSQTQFLIAPGKSMLLFFDCFAKSPCKVTTRFVCTAKKKSKKNEITKQIFDFKLMATFEVPHVTLSKAFLEFRIDIGTTGMLSVLEDDITLMNQSSVPLNMDLTIDEPFYFLLDDKHYNLQHVYLESGDELTLIVTFKPDITEKQIQLKKGIMKIQHVMHPTVDKLQLFGIVNYPNVAFEPPFVDLDCIPVGHTGYRLIKLLNMSPLQVDYSFEISDENVHITEIMFKPKETDVLSQASTYDSLPPHETDEDYLNKLLREELLGENYNFDEFEDESEVDVIQPVKVASSQLFDDELCLEIAKATIENAQKQEELRAILYPIVDEYTTNMRVLEKPILEKLDVKIPINEIRNCVDLVPGSGTLAPYESHILSIAVTPPPYTELAARITCNVAGGASTTLDIFAKSGEMLYNLKSDIIDFGIITFNQIAETTFAIENVGYMSFQYAVRFSNNYHPLFDAEPGWFVIDPAEGVIVEGAISDVVVKYFPGYPGYFETEASLEIAFFDPIKLTIKGCAILPQFYFEFPRQLDEYQNILSYLAIADITYPFHSQCTEDFTLQFEPDYNDWVFVRYKRHYPSARDIAMAVERKIIQLHFIEHPALVEFKYTTPTAIIPDLILPPYIIDLGYVILNTERDMLVIPLKYSDTSMKLYWLRLPRKTAEYGFRMVFQKGQPGPFLVFKPSAKIFAHPNSEVVAHISCVINSTIKIDFEVRAIVTVPSLVFRHSFVDFGRVQCGFALRKTVFLENDGAVTCSYKILIQSTVERSSNIFFTKARDGVVDAGQFAKIDIYFQPQSHTKYEWRLIVYIEANKTPLKISLRGHGFLPELEIIDDKIYFKPTLPYSIANVKYLKIINRSQFPVEICFTNFDKELRKESSIIQTLLTYYNVKKLFIPPRQVGSPLPAILVDIYNNIMDNLRKIFKHKIKNEYINYVSKLSPDRLASQVVPTPAHSVDSLDIQDPLEDRTFDEIQAFLIENLYELRTEEYSMMNAPRKGSIFEIDCEASNIDVEVENATNSLKEGVLIVFHGCPLTDYLFTANKAAHTLKIHVSSVDDLIYEALVRNEIFAANKVNQMILESFPNFATDSDLNIPQDFDMFEIIKHHVSVIAIGKPAPKPSSFFKESKDKKSSKSSKKSESKASSSKSGKTIKSSKSDKQPKAPEKSDTFLKLPIEYFYEMLADSISRYPKGLIVESLTSVFVTKPKLALLGLLKAAGNIRYMLFVYFAISVNDFKSIKPEDIFKTGITHNANALENILQMNADDFDLLRPSQFEIFKTMYLSQRQFDTQRRLSEREARMSWRKILTHRKNRMSKISKMEHLKSKRSIDIKSVKSELKQREAKEHKKPPSKHRITKGRSVSLLAKSQMMEESLYKAEQELVELKFILEHWNRAKNELTEPLTDKKTKSKDLKINKKRKSYNSSISDKSGHSRTSTSPKFKLAQKKESIRKNKISLNEISDDPPKQQRIKLLTPSEIQLRADVGIPMWYMCRAFTESTFSFTDLVPQLLGEDEDVASALHLAHLSTLGDHEETEQLYTVLMEPKFDLCKATSNQFVLYDCSASDNGNRQSTATLVDENINTGSKVKSLNKLGKNGSFRRSSTSILSTKKARKTRSRISSQQLTTKSLCSRRIMQPDDEITLEVNFYPESCGVFTHYYNVEIITLPIPFKIYLEGKADIPRLYMDPNMIFSKVLPEKCGHELGVAYFEKEEVFHLGAAAAQNPDSRIECLIVEDKLNLINESYLSCDVSVGFLDATSDFALDTSHLMIDANNQQFLTVRGHPVHSGNLNATLIVTNRNNPRVNTIKLTELGTNFNIEIKPHDVFFERVLINRMVKIDVELRNTSHIGANWDIDFKNIVDKFTISNTSGYIKPQGINMITFTYEATEYKIIPIQEIQIRFFDKLRHCIEPILQETIKLSAEVVDVDLEFDSDVQLGDNKIGQWFTYTYTFRNKSKFELRAKFLPLEDKENVEMDVIRRSTYIDFGDAFIKPNDVTKVQIKFKINIPVEFRAVPVYNVVISDPLVCRDVIEFVLRVTGKVFSSSYKICPSNDIVFCPQLVDTEVKKDIVIHNTGKYSFTFVLLNAEKRPKRKSLKGLKSGKGKGSAKSFSSSASVKSKKSSRLSKKSKSTSKSKFSVSSSTKSIGKKNKKSVSATSRKTKQSVLKQGIFTLVPSTGVVQPHTEQYIQITCKTKKIGTYSERILFFISGVTGKFSNGHYLTIQGTACVPEVDFTNLVYIFKQYMVLNSQDDAVCHEQLLSSCSFVTLDNNFYFNNTCINSEVEACLHIRNTGEIAANVQITIVSNSSAFRSDPEVLIIAEYTSEMFTIYFKPTALDKYVGTVQLTVEHSPASLTINLFGEGCLPVVQIMCPTITAAINSYQLDYKLVLTESKAQKSILLYNPGPLTAKVLLGVLNDETRSIALEPVNCHKFKNLSNFNILASGFQSTALITVNPTETAEVYVSFNPKCEIKIDVDVKIFIEHNPYDSFIIHVTGQGYKEDVIIEDLESLLTPEYLDKSQISLLSEITLPPFTLISYNLDFGFGKINRLKKKFIKLVNVSKEDTYRFEFSSKDNLDYAPRIGHLKPSGTKDIIISFFSKEPICFENQLQICKLVKIHSIIEEPGDLSWDDRQQCSLWDEYDSTSDLYLTELNDDALLQSHSRQETKSNTKLTSIKDEPQFTEVVESTVAIRLLLNIIVDYSSYEISESQITFSPTTMFEVSDVEVEVRNTSRVPLFIDWNVRISDYPKKSFGAVRLSNVVLPQGRPANRPQSCYSGRQRLTGNENFMTLVRAQSAHSRNSLFSSSFMTGLTSVKSYCDSDPIPLRIFPQQMSIDPFASYTFIFKFAPFTALDYVFYVYSEVPNLKPGMDIISLHVYAASSLPLYYFKITPCDYLTSRRGLRQSCDIEIEEGTKVLEFYAIGLGIPVSNKFSIINPTGEKFAYRWEKCIKERSISLFQCETPDGIVLKGRSVEASFTFIAEKPGTFEMFYHFTIEKYSLQVMFLLVGHAREPCVYFLDNGKSLKPTVVGIDIHDTIVLKNTEDIKLSYKINNASLYSEGRIHKISIEPLKSSILPNSETNLNIIFSPRQIGRLTFNVEFSIERMQKPLVLNITTTCFNIQPTIFHIKEYNSRIELSIDSENIITMPVLVQKYPETCTFQVGNIGKVGFYYKWHMADQFLEDFVKLDVVPTEGYVKTNSDVQTTVTVQAVKFLTKKSIKLELKISYGPTIPITLICSACKTRLKFSETTHDFGACLAQKHKTFSNEWIFEISNNDYINYIIQVDSSASHKHLTIEKKATVLSPKQTMKIVIYFHPRDVAKYNTQIDILVNDKKHPITILGEGVSMEVGLLNISDKFLRFGAVPLGKYAKRRVQIINKTKCIVNIYFELYHRLPIFIKTTRKLDPAFEHVDIKPSDVAIKKIKSVSIKPLNKKTGKANSKMSSTISTKSKNRKDSRKSIGSKKSAKGKIKEKTEESISAVIPEPTETPEERQHRLIDASIRIRPMKCIRLNTQSSVEFTITYTPTERMPVFQEQVFCQVEDTVIPLCVLKASCIAPQYSLHKNKIAFGTVIIGSSNQYCTKLINSGDVGGKFKWSWKPPRNEVFTIEPIEGYSSPGCCTNFVVNFSPLMVHCNCMSFARLSIENYPTTFDLELSGTCINLPSPKDTLRFSGPVRETYTKKFTLKNSTPSPWHIKPSVTGEFFEVDETIVAEAKSSTTVEVRYTPMVMTQPNKLHEGSIFLTLPEGQGMLYELLGEAFRPKTKEVIEKTVSSKTYNVIMLDVFNWLKITQQFSVINQIEQAEGSKKVLYKLTGTSIFDVPPCITKPYKWVIYTLNEGKLNFKVKFRNEATKEYICYELKLNVVKCQVLDKITMSTCARQVVEHKLLLENPLGEVTTYKLSSQCSDLHFLKEATVPPYTEFEVLIEYKPLYPTPEFTTVFEAVSPTLGTFPYNFILSASTAEMEATSTIVAPLGMKNVRNAYVFNPTKANAEFTAKLDNMEFTVEKNVVVKPNMKGAVEIGFEPTDIGGVHSRLTLTSPTLGIYIFPLYGIGVLPKPQGPFTVKPNFQSYIPFKNPFVTAMTFLYAVIGTDFVLNATTEIIKPRSMSRTNISYNRRETSTDESTILTGKLSITCNEGYPDIEWVIYLQADK